MAPPTPPTMSGCTWESYAAQIDLKHVAAPETFNRNRVRNEVEDELEREREAHIKRWRNFKKSQSKVNKKKNHEQPKIIRGQRRKRGEDSYDEINEETAERASKRRNVSIDGEQRPPLPVSPSTSTTDYINPPTQLKSYIKTHKPAQQPSRPVFAHRIRTPDSYNPTWLQTIYDQVYHQTYDQIYDEAYSKAYNLAYNDAFEDAMGDGGADGCHDGTNRGYEDGYREGYKEAYRYWYAEGQGVEYGEDEE